MSSPASPHRYDWTWIHMAALLAGNVVLAFGPWVVRLSDAGPVATGFWRQTLALPVLFALAAANRQKLVGFRPATWVAIAAAGVFFALDLATWHIGIGKTRLGNATLLGNVTSIILMIWGLVALHRAPSRTEALTIGAALAGVTILFGRSLEINAATLVGDLFCLAAGLSYTCYVVLIQRERGTFGSWSLLAWSSAAGAPVLLAIALLLGEPVLPTSWWPVLALAAGSQIAGQGLLVYSMRHFPPLVFGLALLTQPMVAVVIGWWAFGEALNGWDGLGMVLLATALVMSRAAQKSA